MYQQRSTSTEPVGVDPSAVEGESGALVSCGVANVPAVEGASWGPERETFLMESPAPYATLNSIIDNPSYGNELTFFDFKDARDEERGGYCNSGEVRDGEVILFRTYVQNSVAPNLVGAEDATQVTLKLDADESPASLQTVRSTLTSPDTHPTSVHDSVFLAARHPFRLDYIPGSAVLYSNPNPDGIPIDDSVWNRDGALIGPRDDGVITGSSGDTIVVVAQARVTYVG